MKIAVTMRVLVMKILAMVKIVELKRTGVLFWRLVADPGIL